MALKITGWVLLVLGLLLIFYSLYSSFNIFTGKFPVPELFKNESVEYNQTNNQDSSTLEVLPNTEDIVNEAVSNQLEKTFPSEYITKTLDLIVWSVLAWLLIIGGFNISKLGIKILKE